MRSRASTVPAINRSRRPSTTTALGRLRLDNALGPHPGLVMCPPFGLSRLLLGRVLDAGLFHLDTGQMHSSSSAIRLARWRACSSHTTSRPSGSRSASSRSARMPSTTASPADLLLARFTMIYLHFLHAAGYLTPKNSFCVQCRDRIYSVGRQGAGTGGRGWMAPSLGSPAFASALGGVAVVACRLQVL
ncbi:Uncharacterised protein [Mycobacteroides abscessus subsp. abscessus]|nr:Uncharacterised protein [Mycobacteroides abscessus subsp. abscessus]